MSSIFVEYDRLYVAFLYYFNVERDYFECHEVLEELWLEEGRNPLFQGLLQVAVGLYHFRNGNLRGAVKLLESALIKLEHYPADSLGIDLGKLRVDAEGYLALLREVDREPFAFFDLDIELLDPSLVDRVEELRRNPPVKEDDEPGPHSP